MQIIKHNNDQFCAEHPRRGYFITFEGLEGAGKTTLLNLVRDFLTKSNVNYLISRETGGTEIAELIRNILHSHHKESMTPDAELLLVFASRAQHLANLIKPALDCGKWVLCDRFTDSTYAYQGAGRGINADKIALLENFVQGDLRPDLTFLLDIEPEVGLQRISKKRDFDRFEVSDLVFFKRVRNGYLARVRKEPQRFRVIDATKTPLEIKEVAEKFLAEFMEHAHA